MTTDQGGWIGDRDWIDDARAQALRTPRHRGTGDPRRHDPLTAPISARRRSAESTPIHDETRERARREGR